MAWAGRPWMPKDVKCIIVYYLLIFSGFLRMFLEGVLAEREGFEPPIALRLCLISSPAYIL